ncbi:MAG: ComEC/Rec2 family competence protein [Oscillospiraceae bacterium]|nr:ComEC/Rec2 family competence protein [Oscillospiraceae bacterium]
MKRPLVWLTAAFAAAVLLLTNLPLAAYVLPVTAAAAALASLRLVPSDVRGRVLVVCAAVLLAWGSNMLFVQRAACFAGLDGKESAVQMTVLSEEEGEGYSLVTLHGKLQTPSGWKTTTLRAIGHSVSGWKAGDRVEGKLMLQLPKEQKDQRFLYSCGRMVEGRILQLNPLNEDIRLPGGPKVWGAVLNKELSEALTTTLSGQNGAFVQSVLLGRREYISDNVDEDMRRSGAAHVMVVSGLHLSLICGMVLSVLRRMGASRWVQFLAGGLACASVMVIAGLTPSVTRGGIMLLLALAANLVGRQSDSFSSLAAAVLVMGVCNPYVFYSWSFLLSVGSMLSILMFVPPLQKALLKWRKERFPTAEFADGLLGLSAVSLGAAVYTYPMLSVMFGGLPLYGLLGNLLITPLMGILLVSAAAAALLGVAGFGAAASAAAIPAGIIAALCRKAAAFVAGLPGAWLPIDKLWQVVWLFGAALVLTLLKNRMHSRKKLLLVGSSLLAVLLVGAASSMLLQSHAVELRTFENSGSLVILLDGQAVVVDADPNGAKQAANLANKQVLYSFEEGKAQTAALVLQQIKPQAALLEQDTAREITPYLPEEIKILNSNETAALMEGFSLTVCEGYRLIEIDGLRVLKLLNGYAIINNGTEFPAADIIVDGEGMIHQTAQPQQAVRILRFRTN